MYDEEIEARGWISDELFWTVILMLVTTVASVVWACFSTLQWVDYKARMLDARADHERAREDLKSCRGKLEDRELDLEHCARICTEEAGRHAER